MSRSYEWLPDRHIGVAATLAHADETIAQAASILFEYQRQPDGIIRLREVPVVTYSETVVTGLAPIPRKVPLLVADALVSLRNAIEHTIFGEIEHLDGVLDEKTARLVEMPAATSFDDFQEWIKRRQKNGPPSLHRGSELLRRIEGLQPYQRTKDPKDHPMALLASHTNHSKHRAPAITSVRLAAIHREDQSPPSLADVQRLPEVPLQVGDVIARTPRGARIPVALFPTIGINRPGTTRWPVLMKELEDLASWVRTQAVPRLVTGADPPSSVLPARYDIAVGHTDERKALSDGSTFSAAQRHQERLQAASVRQNLVETLAAMDSAPRAKDIAAWLESLEDRDVLKRMDKLRFTSHYDEDFMLSNLDVLEGMRDDARHFADGSAQ
ncbi:hypothetical protein DXT68_08080 [Microbacterium foliorum]|uniref:Uncharacterized protein n=2 Tax=Microbacterium foliorum TaxID=104336 RepID=A0A0F0KA21_9MICO|nr:hypothetical protein DXT68_08080 [Microbacterium foliorum]KJL17728.1 hypothetical protein RN50_02827 [Microbacterium foliorum]